MLQEMRKEKHFLAWYDGSNKLGSVFLRCTYATPSINPPVFMLHYRYKTKNRVKIYETNR